jgi:hypothetical protein
MQNVILFLHNKMGYLVNTATTHLAFVAAFPACLGRRQAGSAPSGKKQDNFHVILSTFLNELLQFFPSFIHQANIIFSYKYIAFPPYNVNRLKIFATN